MSIKYSINLNLYYSFKPSPFFGCKTPYTKHNKGGNKELLTLTYRILLTQFSNKFWLHSCSQKLSWNSRLSKTSTNQQNSLKTKTKKLKSRAIHSHKLTKFHEQLKRIEREQYIEIKESKKHVLITSK